MTDKALENAMKRHNEISLELASLGKQMAELKAEEERIGKFIEAWHEFSGNSGMDPAPSSADKRPTGESRSRTTGNPSKEEVAAKARELIEAVGKPIARNALFADLEAHGLVIRGSDPKMVMSTMLWRMKDEFIRLPGLGYWIKALPYPEANYEPGNVADGTSENSRADHLEGLELASSLASG